MDSKKPRLLHTMNTFRAFFTFCAPTTSLSVYETLRNPIVVLVLTVITSNNHHNNRVSYTKKATYIHHSYTNIPPPGITIVFDTIPRWWSPVLAAAPGRSAHGLRRRRRLRRPPPGNGRCGGGSARRPGRPRRHPPPVIHRDYVD